MFDRNHAIVIGGSMTGLLAARVLAQHFNQVTLIERDFFPDNPNPRPGLPQSRFLHALMKRGQIILESLFPGLTSELIAQGVPVIESGLDVAYFVGNLRAKPCSTGLDCLSLSRDLLDWSIRRRLTTFANVEFLSGGTVTDLIPNRDNTGVAGVSVRVRHAADANQTHTNQTHTNQTYTRQIFADLVIDASGKSSHAPQWLKRLGYTPQPETIVNAFIGYAHRVYQIPKDFVADWRAILVQAMPPHQTRSGILFPIEGDRWMIGLGGGDRDYPPTDEAGYLEFARSLPTPVIYNAIKAAKPLSSIHSYRGTENRLRPYDQLDRYPENFLVMGHATCAFNPLYAQGMTVAAIEAQTLDRCLKQQMRSQKKSYDRSRNCFRHQSFTSTRRMQQQIARAHTMSWSMAIHQDYRYKDAIGKKEIPLLKLIYWYQDQVLLLMLEHPAVLRTGLAVIHMMKPTAAFYSPHILLKVLQTALTNLISSLKGAIKPIALGQADSTVSGGDIEEDAA